MNTRLPLALAASLSIFGAALAAGPAAPHSPTAGAAEFHHLKNGRWSIHFDGVNGGGGDFFVKDHKTIHHLEVGLALECEDGTFDFEAKQRGPNLKEKQNGDFGPYKEGFNPGGTYKFLFQGNYKSNRRARGRFLWSEPDHQDTSRHPGQTCTSGPLKFEANWKEGPG